MEDNIPMICELFQASDNETYTNLNKECMKMWKTLDNKTFKLGRQIKAPNCYLCMKHYTNIHWFYHKICKECGEKALELRNLTNDLRGWHVIVTGARLKLGYQVALKFLRAGAEVIITSRKWSEAAVRYSSEPDFNKWKKNLHVLRVNFDLMKIDELLPQLKEEIESIWPDKCVDVIVHNAAQTICNVPEKGKTSFVIDEEIYNTHILGKRKYDEDYEPEKRQKISQKSVKYPPHHWSRNPYPEIDKYNRLLELREMNTWNTPFEQVNPEEAKQVLIANAWAPFVINQFLMEYLKRSAEKNERKTFIIHVHAKEGHFSSHKTICHTHTNMAKAALSMMTRCLAMPYASEKVLTDYQEYHNDLPWFQRYKHDYEENKYDKKIIGRNNNMYKNKVSIHGVDPGWFSVDEYSLDVRKKKNLLFPPIDEIDAASRIVYPVFTNQDSFPGTWRHYVPLGEF